MKIIGKKNILNKSTKNFKLNFKQRPNLNLKYKDEPVIYKSTKNKRIINQVPIYASVKIYRSII